MSHHDEGTDMSDVTNGAKSLTGLWRQALALLAAAGVGSGVGGVATRQYTVAQHTPSAQSERFLTEKDFSERLAQEAPWNRVEGVVMNAVADVTVLRDELSTIREQQARILTKLDFIMAEMERR